MKRRDLIVMLGSLPLLNLFSSRVFAREQVQPGAVEQLLLSDDEWHKRLPPEQFNILRREATEPAGSSPLNHELQKGIYHCIACDHPLFSSESKYDSGTGWPSFFEHLPNAFETRLDFRLILPRTEYHCARCGGHHGHLFHDGPQPTGLRYCSNGAVLKFVPAEMS